MTITAGKNGLSIGNDFVDCVTGKKKSHGWVEVNRVRYNWVSTVSLDLAEKALRKSAESEGKRVTGLMSQSLAS